MKENREWRKTHIDSIENAEWYEREQRIEKKIKNIWENREEERKERKCIRISLNWHDEKKVDKIAYWRKFNDIDESKVWEFF